MATKAELEARLAELSAVDPEFLAASRIVDVLRPLRQRMWRHGEYVESHDKQYRVLRVVLERLGLALDEI